MVLLAFMQIHCDHIHDADIEKDTCVDLLKFVACISAVIVNIGNYGCT